MALKNEIKPILDYVISKQDINKHNYELFDIYEGVLLKYVLADISAQLSPNAFDQIKFRVSPINVLRRLVEKLSKIYQKPPSRVLELPSVKDAELFDFYQRCYDINVNMGMANEFFNLFKNTLVEPYIKDGKPGIRIIPSDRFVVYSSDQVDPTEPTHVIKYMGLTKNKYGKQLDLFYIYTDTEFLPVDSDGVVQQDILNAIGNPEGINPIGKLPFVYINKSKHSICPPIDTDTLRMTKLFPILLSDLNFAVMYQSFSIMFGIDVDSTNIKMSPNAFWSFKSDPQATNKPEVGMIKPQVDINEVVGFIMAQLSFWLQSRNIRPGQVGAVSAENFSSGVSKIVDEMDTFEDRQKQIPYFKTAEERLWDLTINYMHPYWASENLLLDTRSFDKGQSVIVTFPDQFPMSRRIDVLTEIEKEFSLGLTTKKRALQELNPELTGEEIDALLLEIDNENNIETPEEVLPPEAQKENPFEKTEEEK